VGWCEFFGMEEFYFKYPYIRHPSQVKSGVSFLRTVQDPALADVLSNCKNKFGLQFLLSIIDKVDDGI
jgi:hypothetical protein